MYSAYFYPNVKQQQQQQQQLGIVYWQITGGTPEKMLEELINIPSRESRNASNIYATKSANVWRKSFFQLTIFF